MNKTELFFADKAIFIEGDTERILLPAMMKKIDQDNSASDDASLPLLSQNISIVEVGNYSQVFEKFIDFIGIKSLIITDIDSFRDIEMVTKKGEKKIISMPCSALNGENTSNSSLKYFFNGVPLASLKKKTISEQTFVKNKNIWVNNSKGHLLVVFQKTENKYHARSFEDAFFAIDANYNFININKETFSSLKNRKQLDDKSIGVYRLVQKCIDNKKKTDFALDILYHSSDNNFTNWEIPAYIKEGLLWLKQE